MTVRAAVTIKCDVCRLEEVQVFGGSGDQASFMVSQVRRGEMSPNLRLPRGLPSGWTLRPVMPGKTADAVCPGCSREGSRR